MTKAHTDYLQSNFGSCIKTTSILLKDVALTIPGKDRLLGITRGTFGKVEEAGRGDSKSCEKEQPKEDKNEDKEGRKAINCKSADHQFEAQLGLNQKSEEKK